MSGDTPMRAILIAAATLLATPALAAPAEVSVTIAPALQKTFKTQYGDREAVRLSRLRLSGRWSSRLRTTARGSNSNSSR
jgi:hypothetical protein